MKNFRSILTALAITIALSSFAQNQNNFELSKNLEIYSDVLRQLNLNYADDISPGELNTIAIDALLEKLDPYTVYVPESRREDFELMTRGEYGGIGSLIQKQGDKIVITNPYEGFPAQKAGLRAGDIIVAIDGDPTSERSSSEVSERLKGTPGTSLVVSVISYGDTIARDYEIVREKIKFPNIPFSGMLADNIGYINLSQFNPQSSIEVKNALVKLKSDNELTGLILDLRGNGGGLLNEAVNIVNLFVPKNKIIVTTKGKIASNTQVHKTRNAPVDTKLPLVVLVDGNSASASEIVAGAIQDLDRGIVIGSKTFGKGLVQNIVELPYNSKMKLTVAKYYIPSGRCIQAIDYFDEDTTAALKDSVLNTFKTAGGRVVYDKGGIEPDIKVKTEPFSQLSADLYAQNYIFNFANEFALKNDSIIQARDFIVDDIVFSDFKNYVESQDFNYRTETEAVIDRLKTSSEREDYDDALNSLIDSISSTLAVEKKKDIDKHRSEIEEMLKLEIVARYYYQKGRLESSLMNDEDIKEAIKVLNDKQLYDSILN